MKYQVLHPTKSSAIYNISKRSFTKSIMTSFCLILNKNYYHKYYDYK